MSLMSDFEGLSVAHRPNLYCVGGDVKPHAQSNQGLSVNLEDYEEIVDGIRYPMPEDSQSSSPVRIGSFLPVPIQKPHKYDAIHLEID